MRRTLPGLAVEHGWRARADVLPARQAVSGVGDLCGGCDIRSGTRARCSVPRCRDSSCLSEQAPEALCESHDSGPGPNFAAKSAHRADRRSVSPRRAPPAAPRGAGTPWIPACAGMTKLKSRRSTAPERARRVDRELGLHTTGVARFRRGPVLAALVVLGGRQVQLQRELAGVDGIESPSCTNAMVPPA